jgi:cytochrome c oxidase subunit 3
LADRAATAARPVAHQFDDSVQQRTAAELGMWVFLATEVMFFGGMILLYTAYHYVYPHSFAHASRHLDVVIGGVNTAVLLGSSLTMALAVHGARAGFRRLLLVGLALTIVLGAVFLTLKGVEWHHKWEDALVPGLRFHLEAEDAGAQEIFFLLYFTMTGVHALHLIIGLGVVGTMLWLAWRGRFSPAYYNPVEVSGLYWHFVDIVWIFLLPMLYLIGRHGP